MRFQIEISLYNVAFEDNEVYEIIMINAAIIRN